MNRTTLLRPAAAVALSAVLLSGCGTDADGSTGSEAAGDSSSAAVEQSSDEAAQLSIEDPYVKAADSGMTAAFGTLVNNGSTDVTVVSATSDITPTMELHETTADESGAMMMQPKQGGFTIPAGGTHELTPGGDHLMIMDLTRPVVPGEDVTLTLTLDDGSTMDVVATVKDVAGGDEEYQPMGEMDMGEMSESQPAS